MLKTSGYICGYNKRHLQVKKGGAGVGAADGKGIGAAGFLNGQDRHDLRLAGAMKTL